MSSLNNRRMHNIMYTNINETIGASAVFYTDAARVQQPRFASSPRTRSSRVLYMKEKKSAMPALSLFYQPRLCAPARVKIRGARGSRTVSSGVAAAAAVVFIQSEYIVALII